MGFIMKRVQRRRINCFKIVLLIVIILLILAVIDLQGEMIL